MFCNSFLSLVKPALHVGKQSFGGVGCRASFGRGGIAGGGTTAGAEAGDLLAQPDTSSTSSSSVTTSTLNVLLRIFDHLSEFDAAAVFLLARGLRCTAGCLGNVCA